MKPEEFLKHTKKMAEQLKALSGKGVFVGLPAEKVGGKVYKNGMTILSIGAVHEFGSKNTPRRSFLREPFKTKKNELNKVIKQQFEAVSNGADINIGLGRIGATATNISKLAFTSLGYGTWRPITDETARRKKSSQTLIDTGTLRSSITWVVR